MTQAEIAERAPIALNTLSRRINGLLPFTWPEVVRIAEVTGTTASELADTATRLARRGTEQSV